MKKLFPVIALCLLPWMLTAQYILPKEVYSPAECRSIDSLERNQDYFLRKLKIFHYIKKQDLGDKKVVVEKAVFTSDGFPLNIYGYWSNEKQIHSSDISYSYDKEGYVIEKVRIKYDRIGIKVGTWKWVYSYEIHGTGRKVLMKITENFTSAADDDKCTGTKSYTYDLKGRLIAFKEVGDFKWDATMPPNKLNSLTEYSYNENGQLVKSVGFYNGIPSGMEASFSYDERGRLVRNVKNNKGIWSTTFEYVYNENGSIQMQKEWRKDASDSTLWVTEKSDWNPSGQYMTSHLQSTNLKPGSKDVSDAFYKLTYNAKGLVTKEVEEQSHNGEFLFRNTYEYSYVYDRISED